jgi:hypothetical protein
LTIKVSSSARRGTHTITITGKSGTTSHTTTTTVTIS